MSGSSGFRDAQDRSIAATYRANVIRLLRPSPERAQSWLTFLRNHREVIVAMDFFMVPTATFRVLYVWFAIRHSRREVVQWSVADNSTAPYTSVPRAPSASLFVTKRWRIE
jgi:hypothetical protein